MDRQKLVRISKDLRQLIAQAEAIAREVESVLDLPRPVENTGPIMVGELEFGSWEEAVEYAEATWEMKKWRNEIDPTMSRKEAADYMGVTVSKLDRWAKEGKGPRVRRTFPENRYVYYRKSDCDIFMGGEPSLPAWLTE